MEAPHHEGYPDATSIYTEDQYYERCGYFIEKTFPDRLHWAIIDLKKRYGKSNPSKEELVDKLIQNNQGRIVFRNLYDKAAVKWNQHLGVKEDENNGRIKRK
jgi:hypothetical protein